MKQLEIPFLKLASFKGYSAFSFWGNKRTFMLNASIYYLDINKILNYKEWFEEIQ